MIMRKVWQLLMHTQCSILFWSFDSWRKNGTTHRVWKVAIVDVIEFWCPLSYNRMTSHPQKMECHKSTIMELKWNYAYKWWKMEKIDGIIHKMVKGWHISQCRCDFCCIYRSAKPTNPRPIDSKRTEIWLMFDLSKFLSKPNDLIDFYVSFSPSVSFSIQTLYQTFRPNKNGCTEWNGCHWKMTVKL